ncbi:hypothetical protein [Flavobacterium undicola]|uniref:hypothetical protein n=1 Tax=Flavobacterium undicola TaxID=1932779 RepID=UPI0013765A8E|nr:hypothetical protein [Flavobacterium undicola]MBA0882582.1 hypothetical protein [Flavobacterium undicola]
MLDWIIENYLPISIICTVLSIWLLQVGAEKSGEKTKIEISRKVETEIDLTINKINEKFEKTVKKIDSSTENTIKKIDNQSKLVIEQLSEQSKKELLELQKEMDKVKAISEQLTIANSPTILEIKYIIPLNKFDIRERNELAENLILNFNTALTIYRKEKRTNNLIAEFIGSANQFAKIPLHQAQAFPTNFSKENTFIIYPNLEKENYYIITVYIKLLPSELNNLRGLNKKDRINLVKTKRIENKILTPLNSRMYNAELKIKECSILIGTKKLNLKPLENIYMNYELLLPQIIHMFEVE